MNKGIKQPIKNSSQARGVKSIHRVIDFLDLLGNQTKGLTLSELCQELSLPKSTVHRILNVLVDRQYIRESLQHGEYKLGYEILKLSKTCLAGLDILKEARPMLAELNRQLDETVILGVLDKSRHQVIYIDKLDSSKTIRSVSHIGDTAPVHCTALGKVLLSVLNDNEIMQLLAAYDFKKYTDRTITNLQAFLEEVKEGKKRGYAVDFQEYRYEVVCVAAPIYNGEGKALAAVTVSAPISRLDESKRIQVGHLLVETTQKINDLIEYVPSHEQLR